MVGWGFAFGRGVVVFLWTIVWGIVGGIIALLVTGGTILTMASDPTAIASNPLALIGGLFLGIFLAAFIVTIGIYASIVKVAVDGALKQMEMSGAGPVRSSWVGSQQSIGSQPTLTVAPSSSPSASGRFCRNCGASLPSGTAKCLNCGANY